MKGILRRIALGLASLASFAVTAAQDQPNIFVIFTDDIKRIYYKKLRDDFGKLGCKLISRL